MSERRTSEPGRQTISSFTGLILLVSRRELLSVLQTRTGVLTYLTQLGHTLKAFHSARALECRRISQWDL